MKKITILLISLCAATTMMAQESNTESPMFSVDFSYASRHVFRGLKQSNDTFQTSLDVPIGQGYAGVWANLPGTSDEDYEIDLYVGYKTNITEKLKADVIATLYYYPEASGPETSKSYEAGLGLTYDVFGFDVGARAYYDFRKKAATVQGGIAKSIPVKIGAFKTSLDFDAYIGTVSARDWQPDGHYIPNVPYPEWPADYKYRTKESYKYWGANLRMPYRLGKNALLHVAVHYAEHLNIVWTDSRGDSKFSVSAGITLSF